MNTGDVIALGALIATIGAGAWAVYRDQSSLGQLERLAAVLGAARTGSAEEHLIRTEFELRVMQWGLLREAPKCWKRATVAWTLIVMGLLAEAVWILAVILEDGHAWWYYVAGLTFLLAGTLIGSWRTHTRLAWVSAEKTRRRGMARVA